MIDFSKFKLLKTRYDASKEFKKNNKIFMYYRAQNMEDNTYKYHLFNNNLSFNINFETVLKDYENIKGYWSLYTNFEKYPNEKLLKNTNQHQLELKFN